MMRALSRVVPRQRYFATGIGAKAAARLAARPGAEVVVSPEGDSRRNLVLVVSGGSVAVGVVLVVIGTIFLLEALGVLDVGINELWPVILIAIGLVIVYERMRRYYRRR